MGGGVFTYIVDLANELVNSYDIYIAYAVRKQTSRCLSWLEIKKFQNRRIEHEAINILQCLLNKPY